MRFYVYDTAITLPRDQPHNPLAAMTVEAHEDEAEVVREHLQQLAKKKAFKIIFLAAKSYFLRFS